MTILANIIGGAALAAMFVVFYALGVSAGREATQQREEDINMEHTHGGNDGEAVKGVANDCPATDPESLRPTAHWKRIQDAAYMCTYCKSCFAFIPYNYQYCPECGAKMLNAYAYARER